MNTAPPARAAFDPRPLFFGHMACTLPRDAPHASAGAAPIRLHDARLRRQMAVAFVAMFGVGIAQITAGSIGAAQGLGRSPGF